MELEKKHVAAYFPYDIKYKKRNSIIKTVKAINQKGVYSATDFDATPYSDIKLILHNLSDLTKEIEHNGKKFNPNDRLKAMDLPYYEIGFGWSYVGAAFLVKRSIDTYNQMIEWHFDVECLNGIGLIEHGLAIDINTIK